MRAGHRLALLSRGWWSEVDTPRWAIALGSALTIVASVWLSYAFSERSRVNADHAHEIQQLLDSARQFQVFVSAFATEMLTDKSVSTQTRSKLIENLNDQISRLESVDSLIPSSAKNAESQYRASILDMVRAVNKANDMMSMKDFWSAASKLLVSRNRLDQKLNDDI